MRLVYTTHDSERARTFAQFLSSKEIDNQLEMLTSNDWGNADYGVPTFKIWVYDEDAAEAAVKWAANFEQDPTHPQFQKTGFKTTIIPAVLPDDASDTRTTLTDFISGGSTRQSTNKAAKREAETPLTFGLLMLCCILYIISTLTAPHIKSIPPNIPPTPIISAPINKQFLYDYPAAYELIDKIVKIYGEESLQNPENLPSEGKYLIQEFYRTPYWTGFYHQLLAYFQNKELPGQQTPMFEKIKEGEFWRFFTPALMHNDFLHILFNMMWLIVLGKQLEQRLSARRYLLLIAIIAIFSNTCQYLMSGSNFIGFSGVICGMVAFIWIRQKFTPWEGYPLEKGTTMFILYFISALLAIQIVSFYLEINHEISIAPGIANTAHFTGAIIGGLLGFLPFFKKQLGPTRQKK